MKTSAAPRTAGPRRDRPGGVPVLPQRRDRAPACAGRHARAEPCRPRANGAADADRAATEPARATPPRRAPRASRCRFGRERSRRRLERDGRVTAKPATRRERGRARGRAHVDLWLVLADGTRSLAARTRSAEDGTFSGPLEPVDTLGPLRLVRRASSCARPGPDSSRRETTRALDGARRARAIAADVRLVRSHAARTRRGRGRQMSTVAQAQASLSIADTRLGPPAAQLSPRRWPSGRHVRAGLRVAGEVQLLVRADGAGVHWAEIELERATSDVGDVVLAGGPPSRAARATSDDEPAPTSSCGPIESSTAFQADAFETAVRRARIVETESGLSWSKARTGRRADFEFRGSAARPLRDPVGRSRDRARAAPGSLEAGPDERRDPDPDAAARRARDRRRRQPARRGDRGDDLGVGRRCASSPAARAAPWRAVRRRRRRQRGPETPMALRARARGAQSEERSCTSGRARCHLSTCSCWRRAAPAAACGSRWRRTRGGEVTYRAAIAFRARRDSATRSWACSSRRRRAAHGVPPGEHRLEVEFAGAGGRGSSLALARSRARHSPARRRA
jgi:hypothetical protein